MQFAQKARLFALLTRTKWKKVYSWIQYLASAKCLVDKILLVLETADGFEIGDEISFSVYVSKTDEPSFLVKQNCDITEPHPTPSVENATSAAGSTKKIL